MALLRLNVPRLLKPTSRQISVTGRLTHTFIYVLDQDDALGPRDPSGNPLRFTRRLPAAAALPN